MIRFSFFQREIEEEVSPLEWNLELQQASRLTDKDQIQGVLSFKHDMILKSFDEIFDEYQEGEQYLGFLSSVLDVIDSDPSFFYLKDYTAKIQKFINQHRLLYSTKGEVRKLENATIMELNQKSVLKRQFSMSQYYLMQEGLRDYTFDDLDTLLGAIAYDFTTVKMLDTNMIEEEGIDPDYFLSSVSYLLEIYPFFYHDHSNYFDRTVTILHDMKSQKEFDRRLKMQISSIEKKLELVKKKNA